MKLTNLPSIVQWFPSAPSLGLMLRYFSFII